jgi:hypothetical protein
MPSCFLLVSSAAAIVVAISVLIFSGRPSAEASIAALAAGSPATPNSYAITVAKVAIPSLKALVDSAKVL